MTKTQKQVRVVFFGDSISFGQCISPHLGWVTRLSCDISLKAKEHGAAVLVTNSSINGNTTRQALERMGYDVQSHGVDLLVVQFGLNDCNHWQTDGGIARVSVKAFSANLEEIIERGRRFGARRVLVNTNHCTGRNRERLLGSQLTYEQNNERYNRAIREVVASAGPDVSLIDIEAAFKSRAGSDRAGLRELLQPDLIHLSESGNDLYYETVKPRLLEAFALTLRALSLA